jgi:hypothetical protein
MDWLSTAFCLSFSLWATLFFIFCCHLQRVTEIGQDGPCFVASPVSGGRDTWGHFFKNG